MTNNIYSEISEHFRGYARLDLANIQLTAGREIDKGQVERLTKDFELRGCLRDDPTYAISVIVDSDILEAATTMRLDPTSSLDPLFLAYPNAQAICLRGKHRILAAERALRKSDRWWTVRLFDSKLSFAAQEFIRHEYMHKTRPSDGEIFRRVLDAEQKCDEMMAARWSAMLTVRKRRNLRELKNVDGGGLFAAITPLLPFVALWVDFQPGALNRVLPMRCREEIYHYLKCVHQVWSDILGEDVLPECLDENTVKLLYLRMPAHSAHDIFHVEEALRVSAAFPTTRGDRVRQSLLGRILACEKVLSFKSFHADMILLEACYYPLQQLWSKDKGSFRQTCRSSFQDDSANFEVPYINLWLYIMKNYPKFSTKDTALKRAGAKSTLEHLPRNQAAVAELATFAASCGFRSEMIEATRTDERRENDEQADELPALSGGHREVCLQDRCGRPPKALFDTCWWQISSKGIFAKRNEPAKRHATPYAVVRSFVRCLLELERSYDASDYFKSDSCPILPSEPFIDTIFDLGQLPTTSHNPSPCLDESRRSSITSMSRLGIPRCNTVGDFDLRLKADGLDSEQNVHHSLLATRRDEHTSRIERRDASPQTRQDLHQTTSLNNALAPVDYEVNHSKGLQHLWDESLSEHNRVVEAKDCVSSEVSRAPTVYRRGSSPIPEETTVTTGLSIVTKPPQQSLTTGQRSSRDLRSLRLVELHCRNRVSTKK